MSLEDRRRNWIKRVIKGRKTRPLFVRFAIAPFLLAIVGLIGLLFVWLWILDILGAEVHDWNRRTNAP